MTSTRRRALSVEDVVTLAGSIDPCYEAMVWLGAVLGLRWAEVAGLTVASLDLLRNTVTVTQQLGRDRRLGEPKSQAGRRQFAIPPELSGLLAAHMTARQLPGAEPDRFVFTTSRGSTPRLFTVADTHMAARDRQGRTRRSRLPRPRRANASTLVAEGVDVKTAQSRLGHSDPRMTLSVYAQVVPEADRAAARALGRRFFGAPREQRPPRPQTGG